MDHPTQRLLERTNLPESYSGRLRGAIKGLPLPRGVVHARMPDGSFAVFKDAGGKKRLATFLSKHMSPPGRDVTPLVKEKLMKKSANHMVEPSPDGGNYMAVSNLKSLKRNAEDMMCYVDPATPLPDWVESKLNVAAASIDDVADWFRNGGELNKLSSYSLYDAVMKLAEDPRLEQAGVEGYNRPKRTPGHSTKSHIVVAKDGDQIKTIRFGQQGVKTNQTAGQREAFKSRHAKNIAKGKMSAAYWADKVKWSPSKTKDKDNDNWVKGSSDLSYLKKLADFANETLAQKAPDQVVKEYGLTPQDGSQYWRLKTRIYKSMGGTFTGTRGKKASLTLMSVAKDLRKNASVYDLMLKHSEKEAAFSNPFRLISSLWNSPTANVTRRGFLSDSAKQLGLNALGEPAAKTVRGGSLVRAAGAVAGTGSKDPISRRGFLGQLGLRGALANSALPATVPGRAGASLGSSRLLDAANAASGITPSSGLVGAAVSRSPIGAQQLAPIAEHFALSNPKSLIQGFTHLIH